MQAVTLCLILVEQSHARRLWQLCLRPRACLGGTPGGSGAASAAGLMAGYAACLVLLAAGLLPAARAAGRGLEPARADRGGRPRDRRAAPSARPAGALAAAGGGQPVRAGRPGARPGQRLPGRAAAAVPVPGGRVLPGPLPALPGRAGPAHPGPGGRAGPAQPARHADRDRRGRHAGLAVPGAAGIRAAGLPGLGRAAAIGYSLGELLLLALLAGLLARLLVDGGCGSGRPSCCAGGIALLAPASGYSRLLELDGSLHRLLLVSAGWRGYAAWGRRRCSPA